MESPCGPAVPSASSTSSFLSLAREEKAPGELERGSFKEVDLVARVEEKAVSQDNDTSAGPEKGRGAVSVFSKLTPQTLRFNRCHWKRWRPPCSRARTPVSYISSST